MGNWKHIGTFALVAAFLLTPLDAVQIVAGVRNVGNTPATTLIVFGVVGALIGVVSPWIAPKPHPSGLRALVFDAGIFAGGYVMTVLDPLDGGRPGVFAYLIAAVVVGSARVYLANRRLGDLIFVPLLGVLGPAGEAIDSAHGEFKYTHHELLGFVPLWLPLLWASGAPLVRSLAGQHAEIVKRLAAAKSASNQVG